MNLHPVQATAESLFQIPPTVVASCCLNILISQTPFGLLHSAFCPHHSVAYGLVNVHDVPAAKSNRYSSMGIYWLRFSKPCGPFLLLFGGHDTIFSMWASLLLLRQTFMWFIFFLFYTFPLVNHVQPCALIPTYMLTSTQPISSISFLNFSFCMQLYFQCLHLDGPQVPRTQHMKDQTYFSP